MSGGIVNATKGYAIRSYSSSIAVTVSGGLVFAYGNTIIAFVIYLPNHTSGFTSATGTGVVIGWNQAAGHTTYTKGSSDDISRSPASATATWDVQGGSSGIAYANGTNTGFIPVSGVTVNAAAPSVCSIGATTYATLDDALAAVTDGQTIKLLTNIDYDKEIDINGKKITFDLNGDTLNVVTTANIGLDVTNGGSVTLLDPYNGEFNVTSAKYGVIADYNSTAVVTNATSSGYGGATYGYAVHSGTGSYVEVLKDAVGKVLNGGVHEISGGSVSVGCNVLGEGNPGVCTDYAGSSITVEGNVTSIKSSNTVSTGAITNGGVIIIGGNVTGAYAGVYANVGGAITVDGTVASDVVYIQVGGSNKTQAQYTAPTTKTGYLTYTDGTSTVWVKDTGTGIETISDYEFRIYPNPVKDELRIENGELRIKNVEIFNISGKIILNSPFSILNSINVSALPSGIYLIKIETDKGLVVRKFVKE